MMMPKHLLTGMVSLTAAGLAACSPSGSEEQSAATPSAPEAAEAQQGSVTRREAPASSPSAPQQQAVIQTQPGPDGAQVALNKVRVTGDVMTVQLTYTGEGGVTGVSLDEVSLIDDATAQRIGVLKDNEGKWLAAPLGGGGDRLSINLYESPAIVWFKFPAPPPTSPTVSINIPEVAPFDGVPVTR